MILIPLFSTIEIILIIIAMAIIMKAGHIARATIVLLVAVLSFGIGGSVYQKSDEGVFNGAIYWPFKELIKNMNSLSKSKQFDKLALLISKIESENPMHNPMRNYKRYSFAEFVDSVNNDTSNFTPVISYHVSKHEKGQFRWEQTIDIYNDGKMIMHEYNSNHSEKDMIVSSSINEVNDLVKYLNSNNFNFDKKRETQSNKSFDLYTSVEFAGNGSVKYMNNKNGKLKPFITKIEALAAKYFVMNSRQANTK